MGQVKPAHRVTGFQFLGDARYLHHAGQHGVHPFLLRPVNLQQVRVQLSLKIRLLQRPADVLSSIIAFI